MGNRWKEIGLLLTTFLLATITFYYFVVANYQVMTEERYQTLLTLATEATEEDFKDGQQDAEQPSPNQEHSNKEEVPSNESNEGEILWGVDSVNITDPDFYACVRENFGEPQIWGRYLETKDNVSYGLTENEIEFLHEHDTLILPIYNHFEDATTYERGVAEAEQAIDLAQQYGIPEGVALFADIEPMYPVDHSFILGWHDTMMASPYESGIYGVFSEESELTLAFNTASEEDGDVLEKTILWSNQPQNGITTEEHSPEEYDIEAPEGSRDYAWQYGLDADTCNIDTNLFKSEITDYLW